MDICYAADNNFSMQTAVSIVSVLNTTKDTHLRFHILDSGISEENRKMLTSLTENAHAEIHYYDVYAQLELIREKGQRQWGDICTYATWGRLFLTEVLPTDISRILYLDGDVIAAASLAPLETMDLHGQPLGAVEDCTPHSHRKAIGMNPSSRYFNAGVLLLDMEMWRKMFPHPAVYLDHLLDREKPFPMADQDVLNLLFEGHCTFLPLRYNYSSWFRALDLTALKHMMQDADLCSHTRSEVRECAKGAVLVHYNTCSLMVRPWYNGSTDPARELWRSSYAASPWSGCAFRDEPPILCKAEQKDRALYQAVGRHLFSPVHSLKRCLSNWLCKHRPVS